MIRVMAPGPPAIDDSLSTAPAMSESVTARVRHSSRPGTGRSTDIRIECSAATCLCGLSCGRGGQFYTLRCIFMARITSRDYERFVSHGIWSR